MFFISAERPDVDREVLPLPDPRDDVRVLQMDQRQKDGGEALQSRRRRLGIQGLQHSQVTSSQLGCIRCKHNARWCYLSRMKNVSC